ncbi:MAG TPA: hypothetical protein VKU84_02605 [Stellaceae bacterium]|nr:hypothetical protein [Stellaceae bacterium]
MSDRESRETAHERWRQICDRICDGLDDLHLQVNRDYWFHQLKPGYRRVLLELSNAALLTAELLVACANAAHENDGWTVSIAYIDRQADKLVGLAAMTAGFVHQISSEPWVLRVVHEANMRVSGTPLPRIG